MSKVDSPPIAAMNRERVKIFDLSNGDQRNELTKLMNATKAENFKVFIFDKDDTDKFSKLSQEEKKDFLKDFANKNKGNGKVLIGDDAKSFLTRSIELHNKYDKCVESEKNRSMELMNPNGGTIKENISKKINELHKNPQNFLQKSQNPQKDTSKSKTRQSEPSMTK
jgi:hypothetical protein